MSFYDNTSFYNGGRRTNQKQKHILITAMATNRKILECRAGDSTARRAKEAAWKSVILELNMAGPEKNLTEWRKVWTDLRLGMRKKWEKAQKSKHKLTEYERRVIEACGMIQNPEEEDASEKSAEEINSFLEFLEEELIKDRELSEPFRKREDSNSDMHFLANSSDFFNCQTSEIHVKEEFEAEPTSFTEYKQPLVECIIDDNEQIIRSETFRESSVECISDDEEPMIVDSIQLEGKETIRRPISLDVETIPIPMPLSHLNNKKLPKRKKPKDATLKEIKKMHRNLLRQSKKQTALLRKLVSRMPC